MKGHLEHLRGEGIRDGGMRSLMAGVVCQAATDVVHGSLREAGIAMAFIMGERCRLLCDEIGIDLDALRRKGTDAFRRRLTIKAASRIRTKPGRPGKGGEAWATT